MFSRLSRIVAVVVIVLAIFRLGMAVAIASGSIGPYDQAVARYLGSTSTADAINQSAVVIAVALALGTLGEIGSALRRT